MLGAWASAAGARAATVGEETVGASCEAAMVAGATPPEGADRKLRDSGALEGAEATLGLGARCAL